MRVVSVLAPPVRARSFWVGPADDNEFLAIEAFGFAPQAPVSWRIRCIDRLGNDALEPELACMPADKLAVAGLAVVELDAGNVGDQRLEKRLALDERQTGGVAPVKMQKIENVVDQSNPALAIARSLCPRKARQSIVPNAA